MGRAARERAAKYATDQLILTSGNGDVASVIKLIKNGADVNGSSSGNGTTPGTLTLSPLLVAVSHNRGEIMRILIENGAVVDLILNNATPLVTAASAPGDDLVAMCRILLKHGADVNRQMPGTLESALHVACRMSNAEVARALIEYGADHKLPNANGLSPIDVALEEGDGALLQFLNSVPRVRKSGLRRSCSVCHSHVDFTEPPLKVCAQCRRPRYCSRACQKADWKKGHRDDCEPLPPPG
mmetsp:Transcript_13950/g.41549  ORF Transcript_13950/g.41549 Transcript_13950/m.41549 type:complete len:241 (-) Transcript_13950:23-745(-)